VRFRVEQNRCAADHQKNGESNCQDEPLRQGRGLVTFVFL
jgi:hypothetical protein